MPYSTRAMRLPDDLLAVDNGRIPGVLLTILPIGALHHLAARSWLAMVDAAARDGVILRPTSRADTLRTYSEQVALFTSRFTTTELPGRPTRTWQGQTWWLRNGMAFAAVPGTSNHGWGLAVDVCTSTSTNPLVALSPSGTGAGRRAWDWLIDHYEAFGWSHEFASPSTEPWHIRYVWGDEVPPALRLPDPQPLPPPAPIVEEDSMRLVQPFDGLVADAAVFVLTGHVATWLPTGDLVDAYRAAGASVEPVHGNPWPVPRSDLARLVIAGPVPRYPEGTPGGRTVASDFLSFA